MALWGERGRFVDLVSWVPGWLWGYGISVFSIPINFLMKTVLSRSILILCAILGSFITSNAYSEEEAGVKVVCFGDSITKRGYPAHLAELVGVEVIAAGIAGNSTGDALKRIQTDLLDLKPTHVVVFFGTNDLRADAPHKFATTSDYVANLRNIIGQCQAIDAKVVLCTVPPINYEVYFTRHDTAVYDAAGGMATMIEASRDAVIDLGEELGLPVVDLNRELPKHPEWMHRDGVHPSPAGNEIIAGLVAEKLKPLLK